MCIYITRAQDNDTDLASWKPGAVWCSYTYDTYTHITYTYAYTYVHILICAYTSHVCRTLTQI